MTKKKRVVLRGDAKQSIYLVEGPVNKDHLPGFLNQVDLMSLNKGGGKHFLEIKCRGIGKSIHTIRVPHHGIRHDGEGGVLEVAGTPRSDIGEVPDFGQKLLPFILPKKLRDAVGGDLAEDFRIYATKWGRPYALKWLAWELGLLSLRRFSPATIVVAGAMWFRRKLGW